MNPLMWAVLLLAMSLALLFVEVFVPSGGVLGVLCFGTLLASIIVAFMGGPYVGIGVLSVAFVVFPIAIAAAIRWWPDTPIGRLIMIERPRADEILPDDAQFALSTLVGRFGAAQSPMLPSGLVRIEGRTYDSTCDTGAVETGEVVKVIAVRGRRLIVRPGTQEASPEPVPPMKLNPVLENVDLAALHLDLENRDQAAPRPNGVVPKR